MSVVRLVSVRDSPPVDLQQAKEPPVSCESAGSAARGWTRIAALSAMLQ
eukprot:COSAG06_NODE_10828_length_1610_cov_2.035076_3_plen_48_part_01